MGTLELLVVCLMVAVYVGIISVVVYIIRLARRLVLAVEKIAGLLEKPTPAG